MYGLALIYKSYFTFQIVRLYVNRHFNCSRMLGNFAGIFCGFCVLSLNCNAVQSVLSSGPLSCRGHTCTLFIGYCIVIINYRQNCLA